jgi:hypothetical protein
MPNWCSNNAEFNNDDVAEVARLEAHLKFLDEREKGETAEAGLFGYFVPRPPEFDEGESWYGWNISNWGTKWEASIYSWERVSENCIKVNFDTAWAPPTIFYETIAQNTEWYVTATYWEPGMGFVGSNEGGFDECYEYSNAEDIENIPETLVDEYNLHDQFEEDEEWDAEEELEKIVNDFNVEEEPKGSQINTPEGREWLKGLLRSENVKVTFTKKDGTDREMLCTLVSDKIPSEKAPKNTGKTGSDEAIAVFDLDKTEWRSFRWDSVKKIEFTLGE